jgi:hypothetical protein
MEQLRIFRNHFYAGGICWPSHFGLVTWEPRLRSVFLCSGTMYRPCTWASSPCTQNANSGQLALRSARLNPGFWGTGTEKFSEFSIFWNFFLMKQRRIARNHLYAGGICWPSNFGIVASEPRLRSVFSCSSTMQCAARLSITRQGARFLKRKAFVPPRGLKLHGCFWFSALQLNANFPNCTCYRSLYLFYQILLYRFRVWHGPVFRLASSSRAICQIAEIPGYKIKV